MRIGIDGHVLGKNIGGVERYVQKVVDFVPDLRPQHQFTVFVSPQIKRRRAAGAPRNVAYVSLPVSDPIVQRSVLLPWAVRQHRLDVLHVQRIAPWFCGACRILLTVHDLIPLKYPGAYPGVRDRLVRLLTPGSIARADMIVCPSQSVCDDIVRTFPDAGTPCFPFFSGVDPARFAPRAAEPSDETLRRYGLERGFVFSPGAIEARKNIETVLRALALLDGPRPMLVLSGPIRDHGSFARIEALAAKLGLMDRLRYLGFVPEDDLVGLYANAGVCVAASTDEGFNLLPLEAMACGVPVLCSDIPVHRELYAGAVTFFPPGSPERLALEIARAGHADRQAILDAARATVARLSWEATAARMAGYMDEAGSLPSRPR